MRERAHRHTSTPPRAHRDARHGPQRWARTEMRNARPSLPFYAPRLLLYAPPSPRLRRRHTRVPRTRRFAADLAAHKRAEKMRHLKRRNFRQRQEVEWVEAREWDARTEREEAEAKAAAEKLFLQQRQFKSATDVRLRRRCHPACAPPPPPAATVCLTPQAAHKPRPATPSHARARAYSHSPIYLLCTDGVRARRASCASCSCTTRSGTNSRSRSAAQSLPWQRLWRRRWR